MHDTIYTLNDIINIGEACHYTHKKYVQHPEHIFYNDYIIVKRGIPMVHETDVFICYRRYGAQTAKLFKRYLVAHNFPGKV